MKTLIKYLSLIIISSSIFSCAYTPYVYDDVYYTPGNDPVQQVKTDPRADLNKTDNIRYDNNHANPYNQGQYSDATPQDYYSQNRYTEQEQMENNTPSYNQNYIDNNQEYEDEYYDPAYAQTVININSPTRSFNSYDPYQRDRILYTQDPFFFAPSHFNTFNNWAPIRPTFGIGWNSFNGWNVGFGWNNWGGNAWGGNAWGWNNWGWNSGFCPPFYDPFNPWNRWNAWNHPYSNFGVGPFANNYMTGYRHGLYDGRGFNGFNPIGGNGVRQSNNRRGYREGAGGNNTATNPRRDKNPSTVRPKSGENPVRQSTRSGTAERNANPTRTTTRPSSEQQTQRPNNTPKKYRTNRTPNTYSNQREEQRPQNTTIRPRTNPTPTRQPSQQTTRPQQQQQQQARPNYSRPKRNTYNRRTQAQPRRQTTRPQQSTRPNNNYNNSRPRQSNSRPSYTPSRPSYTPSRGSSGGGGSRSTTPSRSTRPSRR